MKKELFLRELNNYNPIDETEKKHHMEMLSFCRKYDDIISRSNRTIYRFIIFAPMKMFCFIMSMYVLLLTAVPCYSESNCNDKISTEQTGSQPHDDRDNDCSYCSPFFACGTCTGTDISGSGVDFINIFLSEVTLIPIYKSQYLSFFFDTIWQPPKLSVQFIEVL